MKKSGTKKVKNAKSIKSKINEDKILTILIIILVLLSLFLIISRIVRGRILDVNSDLVKELHNYFSTDDLSNCKGLINYTDGLVQFDDIDIETKLCLAYQKADLKNSETETINRVKKKDICTTDGMTFRIAENTNECVINKIDKKIIDDSYKKLFGRDNENNKEFRVDNTHVCYLKDDKYYCGLSETFTYTIGNEATIYRVLSRVVEKGSSIYLYDYFTKIINDTCYKNYTTATINQECTNNYGEDKVNYKFMKKYATKYVHTYKKSTDGTYYWVSSKPITEE